MRYPAPTREPGPLHIHRMYHIPLSCGFEARQIDQGKTRFAKAVLGLGPIRVCCGRDGMWRLDQKPTTFMAIIDAWQRSETRRSNKKTQLSVKQPKPKKYYPKVIDVGDVTTPDEVDAERALDNDETIREQTKCQQ